MWLLFSFGRLWYSARVHLVEEVSDSGPSVFAALLVSAVAVGVASVAPILGAFPVLLPAFFALLMSSRTGERLRCAVD